ncbi:MAG: hypothetical protein AB7V37_06190, partial [Eubacteriaceae bacterium]
LLISFIIYVPFGLAMMFLIIASFILAMPIAAVVFSKLLIRFLEDQMKPLLASFVSILIIAAAVIVVGYIPFLGGLTGFVLTLFGSGFLGYNILFASRQLKEEKNMILEIDDEASFVTTIEKTNVVEELDVDDQVESTSESEEDENN